MSCIASFGSPPIEGVETFCRRKRARRLVFIPPSSVALLLRCALSPLSRRLYPGAIDRGHRHVRPRSFCEIKSTKIEDARQPSYMMRDV